MSANTGEIQPIVSKPWIAPDANNKEAQVIPPVAKAEGGLTKGVGEGGGDSRNQSASGSGSQIDPQVVEQVKSYLQESSDVELNFQKGDNGKMVVQVRDRTTGEVIREIPPESLMNVRDKLEELSGILFDGQA